MCTQPLGEHQDCRRGTRRVFKQFAWLEVGSGKMALFRPSRQYPEGAYPQGATQTQTVGRVFELLR
jgi:hypothetical protein